MAMAAVTPWCARHAKLHLAPYKGASALAIACPSRLALASTRLHRPSCRGRTPPPTAHPIRRLRRPSSQASTTRSHRRSIRACPTCFPDRRTSGVPLPLEAELPATPSSTHCRFRPPPSVSYAGEHLHESPLFSSPFSSPWPNPQGP
jgi:hypothetical protein